MNEKQVRMLYAGIVVWIFLILANSEMVLGKFIQFQIDEEEGK